MSVSRSFLLLASSLVVMGSVLRAEVTIWELPKEGARKSRDGWKVAGASATFPNGVAVDNGLLTLLVVPGADGALLTSTHDPSQTAELQLVAASREAGTIRKVRVQRQDENEAEVQVESGAQEVALRLSAANAFVEVAPRKGATAVDLKGRTKYAILPDFFGNDVVFDPRRYKTERLTAPAENFLIGLLEGGDAMTMCVWPGTVGPGAKDAPPAAEAHEPRVEIYFAGAGPQRYVERSRIEFAGRPVFVALLAAKGIWFERDVSADPAQKAIALDWQRPFEAKWRVDFLNRENACCADLMSGIVSWDAWYTAENAGRPDEAGNPTMSIQGLWPYFQVPAWIKNGAQADRKFYVAMYADMVERKAAESRNTALRAEARKEKKPYTPAYPTNVFERLVVYPIDRRKDTPLTAMTPTDIMRDSLGQGPCAYILDLEGLSGMKGGGTRETLATCGTYDEYISKFLNVVAGRDEWVSVNGKKRKIAGLKAGEKLGAEDQALLVEKLEDLVLFVTAVHSRLQQYRQFHDELVAYCQAETRQPQVKPFADRLLQQAAWLGKRLDNPRMKEFDAKRTKWSADIRQIIEEVKAGNYTGIARSGGIRDDLALPQDILVAFCRKAVKGLRQEAALIDSSDPEVLRFAAKVRDMSHAALRNKHGMEGW
jgi:hypothetical protein